jgi:hypothetical protein
VYAEKPGGPSVGGLIRALDSGSTPANPEPQLHLSERQLWTGVASGVGITNAVTGIINTKVAISKAKMDQDKWDWGKKKGGKREEKEERKEEVQLSGKP